MCQKSLEYKHPRMSTNRMITIRTIQRSIINYFCFYILFYLKYIFIQYIIITISIHPTTLRSTHFFVHSNLYLFFYFSLEYKQKSIIIVIMLVILIQLIIMKIIIRFKKRKSQSIRNI